MRALAFIDCETTGLDPRRHEIIEIAVVRAMPRTLQSIAGLSLRVKPTRIADADPKALQVNGYASADWQDALSLRDALVMVGTQLDGAILAGHNVAFDRAFLEAAWRFTGVPRPNLDHHTLDTASLAWPLLVSGEVQSLSLGSLCLHFGIEHAEPHRALLDARASLDVARRLIPPTPPARPDEPTDRPHRVYVCHPFRDAPDENERRVRVLCRRLVEEGFLPVAPQLYLPRFVDEATERDRAIRLCLAMLDICDEVRVYGTVISEGMRLELERASEREMPVRYEEAL
jgi:DNA polymerase III subunit epsilon